MTIELSIKKARSILKEAKKDHGEGYPPVFEGDIPDDEGKIIEEAGELVEMAEQAKKNDQDHPAIAKILFLAEVDGDSSSNPDATEEPIEDYDGMKAGAIIRQLPELDDETLGEVFNYERENKNREPVIESLEEIAEERGISTDGEASEEDGDYKPWGSYDEDKPKRIITQIGGMDLKDATSDQKSEFFQKILDYETENEDRARIKAVIEGVLEEIAEESSESDDSHENDAEESGEYLSRQDIEDMTMDELIECVEYNELDPDEIIGEDDLPAARVHVAAALDLEWDEKDEGGGESEDSAEEGVLADIDWEVLSQLDLSELKDIIKEKDLGMRAGTKTDLDKLRERMAEALGIPKPAETPWRGYDKREPEQIIKKLSKLDDEDLGLVFAYEQENENRSEIMEALQEIADERGLETGGQEETEDEAQGDESEDQGSEGGEDDDASSDAGGETKKSRRKRRSDDSESDEEAGGEPDHDELISHVTAKVEEEHFAIPAPLPENITTLPFDLTELSEREVRQQYSAFLSYFGRAAYVAKIEKQLAIACKNVADDAYDDALVSLDKIDPETEKDKSATQLKAEAERAPKVRKWRKRERQHASLKESMRADCEIYKQNLDSLSREWTMRTDEIDHSGGLGPRGKAGKKVTKKSRK